jgi:hypothetical protein
VQPLYQSGNFRQEDENSAFTSSSANLSAGDAVTVEAFQTTAGSKTLKILTYTFFGGFRINTINMANLSTKIKLYANSRSRFLKRCIITR